MTRPAQVHPTAVVGAADIADTAVVGPFAVIGQDGGLPVVIGHGADIGANATVTAGVRIGRLARVLPNTWVDTDVPPLAIVGGVPATIRGYLDPVTEAPSPPVIASSINDVVPLGDSGANLVPLRAARDLRGSLVVGEFGELPFTPQRFFCVFGVASGNVRGEHAHRRCEQLLVALAGSVRCIVDDGVRRFEAVLDTPRVGLHLPAMVWGTQFGHSADAVLLVLASLPYDSEDYIREYEQFLDVVRSAN